MRLHERAEWFVRMSQDDGAPAGGEATPPGEPDPLAGLDSLDQTGGSAQDNPPAEEGGEPGDKPTEEGGEGTPPQPAQTPDPAQATQTPTGPTDEEVARQRQREQDELERARKRNEARMKISEAARKARERITSEDFDILDHGAGVLRAIVAENDMIREDLDESDRRTRQISEQNRAAEFWNNWSDKLISAAEARKLFNEEVAKFKGRGLDGDVLITSATAAWEVRVDALRATRASAKRPATHAARGAPMADPTPPPRGKTPVPAQKPPAQKPRQQPPDGRKLTVDERLARGEYGDLDKI